MFTEKKVYKSFLALQPDCTQCRFFRIYEEDKSGTVGICRRNPPTAVMDSDGGVASIWPMVDNENFCGEFIPST